MTKRPFTAEEMMLAMSEKPPDTPTLPKPIDHMQLSCSVCMSGYNNPNAGKEMTLTRAEIILQTIKVYGLNNGGD